MFTWNVSQGTPFQISKYSTAAGEMSVADFGPAFSTFYIKFWSSILGPVFFTIVTSGPLFPVLPLPAFITHNGVY